MCGVISDNESIIRRLRCLVRLLHGVVLQSVEELIQVVLVSSVRVSIRRARQSCAQDSWSGLAWVESFGERDRRYGIEEKAACSVKCQS